MAKKRTETFDPNEVEGLLQRAKAGDIVARDELLYRFQRLVATLVHVCITGRPNYWSSYQQTFLKLFAGRDVPVQNTAMVLKIGLTCYQKEELFSTGQLAVLEAIKKCEKNLASTIVICFKDLIHGMIKDPLTASTYEIDVESIYEENIEDQMSWDIFIDSLSESEYTLVTSILEGKRVRKKIPDSLKEKMNMYLMENPIQFELS